MKETEHVAKSLVVVSTPAFFGNRTQRIGMRAHPVSILGLSVQSRRRREKSHVEKS